MVAMLDELLALTPTQFEEAIARLLVGQGYRDVERVGGAGDQGIDLRCKDASGRSTIVQCKRYAPSRVVGAPLIQHFFGMIVHDGAEHGIFVTTSSFTAPARELALHRDIQLIDGAELTRHYDAGWQFEDGGDGAPRMDPTASHAATVFSWHPQYRGRSFEDVYEELRARFVRDQSEYRRVVSANPGQPFTEAERRIIDRRDGEWIPFAGGGWHEFGWPWKVAQDRLKYEVFREEKREARPGGGEDGWEAWDRDVRAMEWLTDRFREFLFNGSRDHRTDFDWLSLSRSNRPLRRLEARFRQFLSDHDLDRVGEDGNPIHLADGRQALWTGNETELYRAIPPTIRSEARFQEFWFNNRERLEQDRQEELRHREDQKEVRSRKKRWFPWFEG